LKSLMEKDYLEQFVLVGGTALALQIGHRKSIDLDMFTISDIDTDILLEKLKEDYSVVEKIKTKGALIIEIEGVKVDFIRFKYRFNYPVVYSDGIRLANIDDIAPMKLDAITGRGSKKDFFDLYYLLEQYSLDQMLQFFSAMYPHSTLFHVIKSLAWFADADPQSPPKVLDKKVTWGKVKERIEKAVAGLK
jgi:predicted nucleotidyltransferase component of viral defense system